MYPEGMVAPMRQELTAGGIEEARTAADVENAINQKGTLNPRELTLGLAFILLPGMLVTFGLWAGMLALFRHGGVGGTLASMNAR